MTFVCTTCGHRGTGAGYCPADGSALAETNDPVLGTEIGRYRVARLLGEGGMGAVYLGIQPTIGSRVAIKVLSAECARSPELLERFFAEARSVNLIRHENIVSVLDLAQLPDGRPYIVMEFIEGHTLGQIVRGMTRTGDRVPIGGVVQVASEMLSALGAAHALGIVHRDLKPDNVLVTGEGHAKVLDFGIAKLAPGLDRHSPRTRTGALLGTPAYMAPEQISVAGLVDPRTDIYAAGVVLFETITGTQPFTGETLFDLMRAHMEIAPPSPRERRPDLPLAMEQVILTALDKQPARRFQSAAAMAQALRHAASELPADQWRSLSGKAISGRISMEQARQHTPPDAGRGPTHHATPVPSPQDAAKTERTPQRKTGLVVALAAIALVAIGVGVLATRGGDERPSEVAMGSAVDAAVGSAVATPAGSAAVDPVVPPVPATTGAPATTGRPPARAPSLPTTTRTPPPPRAAPAIGKPGPTIAGGGSAADHGVHIGPGVTLGPNVVIGGAPPAPGTAARSFTRPIDYNAKKFDAKAYAPKALALARQMYPDAGFIRMDIHGVFPAGHADLTLTDDDSSYLFRSQAHSARPAGVPKNLDVDIPCHVEVTVGAKQIEVDVRSDGSCRSPLRPLPACSLAGVWAKAKAKGADPDTFAKIGFLTDGEWFFDNDGDDYEGLTESFADRCP